MKETNYFNSEYEVKFLHDNQRTDSQNGHSFLCNDQQLVQDRKQVVMEVKTGKRS